MVDTKHTHEPGQKCIVCDQGIEALQAKEKEHIAKYGWYVHFVEQGHPCGINAHTHHLKESYNHLDFQIVLPINIDTIHKILCNLVDRVKEGEVFEANDDVYKIISDYPVRLISAQECDRKVLRVILPDSNGSFDPKDMSSSFRSQYED